MSKNQTQVKKTITKKIGKAGPEVGDIVQKRFNILSNKIQYCVIGQNGRDKWVSVDQAIMKFKQQKGLYDKFIKQNHLVKQPNQDINQSFIYFCRLENAVLQKTKTKLQHNPQNQLRFSSNDSKVFRNQENIQMSQLRIDSKINQESLIKSNHQTSSKKASSSVKKSLFKEINPEQTTSLHLQQNGSARQSQSLAQNGSAEQSQLFGQAQLPENNEMLSQSVLVGEEEIADRFKTESKKSQKIEDSEQKIYRSPLDKISGFLARVLKSASKKKENSIF